jgi:endonuclease-3
MDDLTQKGRARRLARGLALLYPDARCALDHDGPLQLLVATILSAQCTDVLVNKITPALFARYPTAADYATADPAELESFVRRTNYFRTKAKNLILCCQQLVERHGGEVPGSMEDLVALAGVGRKTANVVLSNCFDVPGIPVDTHVARLSQRMGLTLHTDPVRIESDLNSLLPRRDWTMFGKRMIDHGRQVCHARKPMCEGCTLAADCAQVGVASRAAE